MNKTSLNISHCWFIFWAEMEGIRN
uniref:Uncharacterized protein n=1 Tax=Anguilla anguilla TaxID=7936 RepID=A0A0E9UK92_ANGAN